MEETQAYDGDAAAWEQWQVPPAALPPVPLFGGGASGGPGVTDAGGRGPNDGKVSPAASSSPPRSSVATVETTLVQPTPPREAAAAEAPTLAYEDQVAPDAPTLTYDTQPFLGCPDFAPSEACAPTFASDAAVPATLAYEDGACAPKAVGYFPDTLAYDADAIAPHAAALYPATQAYDDNALFGQDLPSALEFATANVSPPVAAAPQQHEEVAPTLDYGEDTIRPIDAGLSPPKAVASPLVARATEAMRPPASVSSVIPRTSNADVSAPIARETFLAGAPRESAASPRASARSSNADVKAGSSSSSAQARKQRITAEEPLFGNGGGIVSEQTSSAAGAVEDRSIFAVGDAVQARKQQASPGTAALAAESREGKRRRLRGKQNAPPAFVATDGTVRSCASVPTQAAAASSASPRAANALHTAARKSPRPSRGAPSSAAGTVRAGTQVLVLGDGWGGEGGEYLATVMETDAFTFTVIRQFSDGRAEETIVQREYCSIVSEPEGGAESRRSRTSR